MAHLTLDTADLTQEKSKEPRLKICLASMAPFVGGAEVAAERLAVGLREEGHEVLLLLGHRGEVMERAQRAGLRCVYSPMYFTDKWRWWRYVKARTRLRDLIGKEQPDIVHSNDLPTHQIVSDAARGLGIPRICHHRYPFDGGCIDWLNKYGAEHHLFVSRALMKEMCANSRRLASSSRSVVYDGLPLPPRPTERDRQQARKSLNLPPGKVIVTFVGQIIERKGVADLLRAWSLLDLEARNLAELVIVGEDLQGDGIYQAAMQRLALDLRTGARFVGFQKNVDQWLTASDVAVVPSHIEPLGNATLEAMSYGLPVLGSKAGGIPEMIAHEQTGLLVPPQSPGRLAAALSRLIRSEPLRRCLGRQGRQRCEKHFSLAAHVRSVVEEYGLVLGGRTRVQVA